MIGQRGGGGRNQQLGMQQLQMPGMGVHSMGGHGMGMVYYHNQGQYSAPYEPMYHHQHQQQQQQSQINSNNPPTPLSIPPSVSTPTSSTNFGDGSQHIIEVWADQLEEAFEHIRHTVVDYPYVAMDTEFPGVVARPVGSFKSNSEFYYQTLRCNVNLLKIIQLGITFSNEKGEHPPKGPCTWQFNFKFNLREDIYAQESIDLLSKSGIDFERFERDGIDVSTFAELLTSSGLVLSSDPPVKWLSFHSGYDFGYLIKVLTSDNLPSQEDAFFELMKLYFPVVYDVKYLLKQTKGQLSEMCGLNKLGEELEVRRIGPVHQAGSDSLLTSHCFFKLGRDYLADQSMEQHCGILYGLGADKGNDMGSQQNGVTNPAFTPSTPAGASQSNGISGQFPSSPSMPLQRGPQVGQYNTLR